jgi:hypothetical protein
MFPGNEGKLDRAARVVLGGGLLACAVAGRGISGKCVVPSSRSGQTT